MYAQEQAGHIKLLEMELSEQLMGLLIVQICNSPGSYTQPSCV